MKSIFEILGDTNPKSVEKLQKAFEKGECAGYKEEFLKEALSSSAKDFANIKCLVTDNYFCCYTNLVSAFSKSVMVFPLSYIANLYRSNINAEPKYDYTTFFLQLEITNGKRIVVAPVLRRSKNAMNAYDEIVKYVRSKKALEEV